MIITVPFSLGGAVFCRILRSTVEGNSKSSHRTIGCNSICGLGFIGLKITSVYMKELGQMLCIFVKWGHHSGLMSMPIIVSISEDALNAVPDSYREAAIGLGVTKWQRYIACCCLAPKTAF